MGSETFSAIPIVVCEADKQLFFGRAGKQNLGRLTCYLVHTGCPDNKLNISKYLGKCQKKWCLGVMLLKAEVPRPCLDDKGCRNHIHLREFCYCFLTLKLNTWAIRKSVAVSYSSWSLGRYRETTPIFVSK